jgi:carbonic anhydrase/acetyltransferase-like protein (isoleucine patch superfamily)
VEIGKGCVIFDNVVIEGYPMKVRIGESTNIQSGTIIHGLESSDTIIGNYCTIGHQSLLHGCTLEDCVTIGLASVVMGHSIIRKGGFVAAGSLIPERKEFPENALIMGRPGQFMKDLGPKACDEAKKIAIMYEEKSRQLKTSRTRLP